MTEKSSRRSFVKTLAAAGAAAVPGSALHGQSAGRVAGFDHVALPMQNTDAMIAFYRALGFQIAETTSIVSVYAGPHMINFHRPPLWQNATFTLRAPSAKPPCGDLCFVWEGSADGLRAMLETASARVEVGPVPRQGGQQRAGTSTYTRDPDGNLLEFIIYA
jgi:catechol 2,3-dioxygenase-like lactoylglutathione lyase family enzyme